MAWNDEPPTKAELEQPAAALAQSWDSAPPSKEELSVGAESNVDPEVSKALANPGFGFDQWSKLTPEQREQYTFLHSKKGEKMYGAVGRGIEKGAGLPFEVAALASDKLKPAALAANFEKNVIAPAGDALTGNDTSDIYKNKSDEELQNTYNQDIEKARQEEPGSFALGNIAGSLPTYSLGGGLAGTAAKGLGGAIDAGKLTQAAINIPAQAAAQGSLAARQGYTENPYASEAEKEAAAKKSGIIGGVLGAGGQVLQDAPAVLSSLGKSSSNKLLSNASLGAEGVNTATSAGKEAITARGEKLASKLGEGVTNLNETVGKQAANDIRSSFESAANNAQTSVEDIVNKVSNNIDTIGKVDGQAAVDTINDSFAQALKQTGEDLKLTGSKLTDFIKDGLNKYGPVIKQELSQAAQQGKTIPVDENFLRTFLAIKNAKVSLSEANNVQDKLWKNWADTLYDVSENVVKQKAGTVPGGTMSEVSVQGKGVLPSELPQPQSKPEFVQGAQGNPESPAVSPSKPQAPAPNVEPGVNSPLNVTENKNAQATSGQFMGQPYANQSGTQVQQTFTPKAEIPVEQAKQFSNALGNAAGNPNLEEIQPLAADLASQLRKSIKSSLGENYSSATSKYSSLKSAMEEMGVPRIEAAKVNGDNITPDSIMVFVKKAAQMADQGDTATLERVYGHLNEVDPTFAANFKNEVDQISRSTAEIRKAANAAPEAKADILQQQGKASPEVGKAQQTLQDLNTVQKQIGGTVPKIRQFVQNLNPSDIGAQNDVESLLKTLDRLDPESAALLRSKTSQSAVNRSNMLSSGLGKNPLEQADILKQAGSSNATAEMAANKLEDLNLINKNVGKTSDLGTPSDTTRDFIRDFGKSSETPNGSARASDIDAVVQKLSGIDPTLAAAVKEEAPEVGRQLRAIDYNQSGSPFGSPVQKVLGGVSSVAYKGSNVLGQATRQAGKLSNLTPSGTSSGVVNTAINSRVANSLQTLEGVVRQSPQSLGQYAQPLQQALSRGPEAFSAMIFTMNQRDPQFKKKYDEILDTYQGH